MLHSNIYRYSLIIAFIALILLTTPLLNLLIRFDSASTIISTGAGLFLFWMVLIITTILINRLAFGKGDKVKSDKPLSGFSHQDQDQQAGS